jgi:hypothetical protein
MQENGLMGRANGKVIHALVATNLYTFFAAFENKLHFPQIFKYLASVYALGCLFSFFFKSQKLRISSYYVKFILVWFSCITLYLCVTGVRFEKFFVQEFFVERSFFIPYLLPFFFLRCKFDIDFFRRILFITYKFLPFAILAIILCLIFESFFTYPRNLFFILTFSFVNSLLLYVSHLLKWKYVTVLSLVYHILFMTLTAINGRRGETLEQVLPVLVFIFIRINSSSVSRARKIILVSLSSMLLTSASIFVYSISDRILMFQRGFSKEGFDESRGDVAVNFLLDFGSKPNDYLIGRGLNGIIRKFTFGPESKRFARSIEMGYFNILIKGGFLYLIPMMLLFFSSFYLGLFSSRNDLAKGIGFLIFWHILYMASFGMALFNVTYFMVWIAVAACLNRELRGTSNTDLQVAFNRK